MENKKFRPVTVKDENGNAVRKWVPAEEAPEPECHRYGNYVTCEREEIEAAKEALIEQVFEVIREVAKKDRFWIVKDTAEAGKVTVAWKIDFPQMYTQEPCQSKGNKPKPANDLMWTAELMGSTDYKERFKAEYHQTKIRHDKLHKMCTYYEAGTLDFEPTCSLDLLTKQKAAMGQYLHCLEVRAQIEGIEL